jgi:hypothetical protein
MIRQLPVSDTRARNRGPSDLFWAAPEGVSEAERQEILPNRNTVPDRNVEAPRKHFATERAILTESILGYMILNPKQLFGYATRPKGGGNPSDVMRSAPRGGYPKSLSNSQKYKQHRVYEVH